MRHTNHYVCDNACITGKLKLYKDLVVQVPIITKKSPTSIAELKFITYVEAEHVQ